MPSGLRDGRACPGACSLLPLFFFLLLFFFTFLFFTKKKSRHKGMATRGCAIPGGRHDGKLVSCVLWFVFLCFFVFLFFVGLPKKEESTGVRGRRADQGERATQGGRDLGRAVVSVSFFFFLLFSKRYARQEEKHTDARSGGWESRAWRV